MLQFQAEGFPVQASMFSSAGLDMLLGGHYVRLEQSTMYKTLKADHCQLTLAQERLYHDTLAVHLQKGSPYTEMFNRV